MVAPNDKSQRNDFSGTGKNAIYISPKDQNQMIEAVATTFQPFFVDEGKQGHFVAVLADKQRMHPKLHSCSCAYVIFVKVKLVNILFYFNEIHDFSGIVIAPQI